MVTEISPVFGWTLLELLEIAPILISFAILVSAAVTGGFSYKSIKQNKIQMIENRVQVAEQLKLQNKIASAQLTWKLLEYWRDEKHSNFTDFMEELYDSKIKEDDPRIADVLQIFEDIAVFCNDESLTENHTKEFFGPPLRIIRESQIMQDHIKKVTADSNLIYLNLRLLFEKTLEWKI